MIARFNYHGNLIMLSDSLFIGTRRVIDSKITVILTYAGKMGNRV